MNQTNTTEELVNDYYTNKTDKTELRDCATPSQSEINDARLSDEFHNYQLQQQALRLQA